MDIPGVYSTEEGVLGPPTHSQLLPPGSFRHSALGEALGPEALTS